MSLSKRQAETLDYIKSYRAEFGVSPTYKEISEEFSCSLTAIVNHTKALIRKGALTDPRGRARMMVPV